MVLCGTCFSARVVGQFCHRPSGMATAPRQPAPGAVAFSLNGRPHGTMQGQVAVGSLAGHGQRQASATVKILRKVLPET